MMMTSFNFQDTSIPDLKIIRPFVAADERGYFSKPFEKSIFAAHGIYMSPYEELESKSLKGVLRGLHFQRNHCQDKIVHVLCGAVYDVAVDLRSGSTTFGKWEGFILSSENQKMLYIPRGFAHGFLALESESIVGYLCGGKYDPESDDGIRWDDPELAINWPLEQVDKVILSDRDSALPTLAEFKNQYGSLESGEAV